MMPARMLAGGLLVLALVAAACAPATPQRCHRYDALSLARENGFAASLDWKDERAIDVSPERLEVTLTIVPPIRGPVELVHVLGDVETDRWALTVMNPGNLANAVCWLTPPSGTANCGATLPDMPYFPGGYYYLRPNANVVMEAGIAFYICN
jgi:hypothetical protein